MSRSALKNVSHSQLIVEMSNINVQPKDIITTQTCTEVRISILTMEFGSSATFSVILLDADHKPIKMERVLLEGADYAAWTNDDSYVSSFILARYGLTPASQ
jgi:hypothetical protein